MVIGSNLDMMPDGIVQTTVEDSLRGSNANLENSLHSEIQLILQGLRGQDFVQQGRDLNMYRSGSAPPTVEGSLNAVGSLFKNPDIHESNSSSNANGVLSEDDIRLHPAYLSYYYSHDNINPRLPPPLLSKEDWRVAQRFQAGAPSFVVNGDPRRMKLVDDRNSSSLFSMQPGISLQRPENEFMGPSKATVRSLVRQSSAEWLERAPHGLAESGTGMGSRRKSFADILQEGLEQPTSLSGCWTSPGSCNGVCGAVDGTGFPTSHQGELCNGGATISHHFASAVGSSLSRSTTPEAQIVGRSSCPGLPPVSGKSFPIEKNTVGLNVQDGLSSRAAKLHDISASFSSLQLSGNRNVEEDSHLQSQLQQEFDNKHDLLFNMPNVRSQNLQQQYISNTRPEKMGLSTDLSDFARKNGSITEPNVSKMGLSRQGSFPRRTSSSANLHSHMNSSGLGNLERSNCQGTNISGMGNATNVPAGYFLNNNMSSEVNSHLDTALSDFGDGRSSSRSRSQAGPDLHFPVIDSQYAQYSRRPDYVSHGSANTSDPYSASNHVSTSHGNLLGLQKAYLDSILAQQKQQYELLHISKCGGMDHGYYVNPSYSHGMPFQNRLASFPVRSGGPTLFQNERFSRSWNSDSNSAMDGRYASSLLEEFKSNKTSAFELSDIVDHVVEFSKDQYGSRFIQQKLETATMEEKTKIFPEIVPHAPTLMTDVFGNYVIQKFFEHGTESQRKELAGQLTGHVLPLSLQMYGCRVIQKALEVVDVAQQTSLVSELDGSVMKCVRDQNGNHVIQKCIECVPQHRIQFIITAFYGQVVALSTHPYGCRVIQRVLEHCDEMNAQQIIMDEVMQSVCTLAQDQYGNYVIQHVLQHGKAHERSDIISKLAGQIVKMSQQKFASNVVEKCLTFGGPEERQLLVNEMLGSTDENEPLQAMMKDPFGNYVVQKVLETCDDQSRELILSRIKVHLNTLKRYTYGKHIVSRVEKLITAGERHAALSSSFSS